MNKLIIAAAGSGKTQTIVNDSLSASNNVLITTYTNRNVEEIYNRIYKERGFIPPNITILPWYTFVLKYFVKPYQDIFYAKDIRGVSMSNKQSTIYISKTETEKYYFAPDGKIYSDKISPFAIKCLDYYKNTPITNFSRIYQTVYIDEIQDMVGFDLEIIKRIIVSQSINLTCVGDPRQGVFFTAQTRKNVKYKREGLIEYFEQMGKVVTIDNNLLNTNHRCPIEICQLSDKLYPSLPPVQSDRNVEDSHRGVYFVRGCDIYDYVSIYHPMQLISSSRTKKLDNAPSLNFGLAKGGAFDRVLIYPSKPMLDLLLGGHVDSEKVRANLYVALTRARISVGIVYNYKDNQSYDGIKKYLIDT